MLPAGKQPGGAPANVALHAHALGIDTTLASAIGDDAHGHEMLARLRARRFPTASIRQIPGAQTGLVDIALNARGIPEYRIRENAAWDRIAATPALRETAAQTHALYYGTLAQRAPQSRATLHELLRLTPPASLRFLDVNLRPPWPPASLIDASLKHATILKLNHEELPLLAEWLGLPPAETAFAAALFARYPAQVILLTKGPQGADLHERGRPRQHIPAAPAPKIVDTVGAGDAFSAGYIAARLHGHPPAAAARQGSTLAARVCATPGAWLD
jgi:fructokinase